jgi:hypothetical protein
MPYTVYPFRIKLALRARGGKEGETSTPPLKKLHILSLSIFVLPFLHFAFLHFLLTQGVFMGTQQQTKVN